MRFIRLAATIFIASFGLLTLGAWRADAMPYGRWCGTPQAEPTCPTTTVPPSSTSSSSTTPSTSPTTTVPQTTTTVCGTKPLTKIVEGAGCTPLTSPTVKDTTTVPNHVVALIPAPTTTAPPSSTPTTSPVGDATTISHPTPASLPVTGNSVVWPLIIAIGLTLAGGAIVTITRRRAS